jgi:hypothetical protein
MKREISMTGRTKTFVVVALLSGFALLFAGTAAQAQAPAESPAVCLYAFSKNLCSSALSGGTWGLPFCTTGSGGTGCNNLVGTGVNFRGPLTNHGGRCGDDPTALAPCDEAPDFIGTLVADVDVRTQRHTPCKARGSWEGAFRLVDVLGVSFASGNLVATMGMGTHRKTECTGASCSQDCETCHDAKVISHAYDWQIGSEGTLKGRVQSGKYAGCSFTASFQGDFTANGDSRGPQTPNTTWPYCGTLEGVLECPCPQ